MLYIQNQRNRSRSNWAKEHAWTMKLYSCFYIENSVGLLFIFRNNRSATDVQQFLKFLTVWLLFWKKVVNFGVFFYLHKVFAHCFSQKVKKNCNSKLQLIGFGISGLGLRPGYSPLLHLMCTLKYFKPVVQPTNRQNLSPNLGTTWLLTPDTSQNNLLGMNYKKKEKTFWIWKI